MATLQTHDIEGNFVNINIKKELQLKNLI